MDRQSRSYLRHVIPESDLLDENVTAIEQLENVRDPYTEFEAIYFIQSSHTSFKCIAKDFESNNMYSKAHVRVSGPYTQSMIRPLESEHVSKFIASVYNSGLNFIAREQRVFETGDKFSFLHLYNPNCEDLCRPELASIASKVCPKSRVFNICSICSLSLLLYVLLIHCCLDCERLCDAGRIPGHSLLR